MINLKNVLIVARPGSKMVSDKVRIIKEELSKLKLNYGEVGGEHCLPAATAAKGGKPDMVITVGGDGTLLHAVDLFPSVKPPIFLPISSGTLGFMLPLDVDDGIRAIRRVASGSQIPILKRQRLRITQRNLLLGTALNEIHVHRGSSTGLARLECFIDGSLLTEAIADGLLVSTATGSTAYSLSAGGPVMHPALGALLLTPICPRSLSFRPILLPSTSSITLKLSPASRSAMQLAIDGREAGQLSLNDAIDVSISPHPLSVICREEQTKDWVHSINNLLAWNFSFNERVINRSD